LAAAIGGFPDKDWRPWRRTLTSRRPEVMEAPCVAAAGAAMGDSGSKYQIFILVVVDQTIVDLGV